MQIEIGIPFLLKRQTDDFCRTYVLESTHSLFESLVRVDTSYAN